jgi:hypothetical protein
MAQGINGLSHYGLHLPGLVLLLEKYLSKSLAHTIKQSILMPATGGPGHFIAKDFFLEIQNYWLKYFHNDSVYIFKLYILWVSSLNKQTLCFHIQGNGTDIKPDRYSINIPLVSIHIFSYDHLRNEGLK